MKKVIEIKNLIKQYGNFTAVNDISFDVLKGEIFGLLGENGAGKTTTLEIIEGLRKPTSGSIKVLGYDAVLQSGSIKEKIGVQLQSSAYYNFLTLTEILDLFGSFYGKKIDSIKLLEMVDLTEKSRSLVGDLSGGQKQRFSIVASLVNDPEIVFLDEPTTGLDPVARRNLWGLISQIKKQGKTIVLTTHYMEEAERLCDRIAVMDQGKILVIGETHKLVEKIDSPYRINFVASKLGNSDIVSLKKLGGLEKLPLKQAYYEMKFKDREALSKALTIIIKIDPEDLKVSPASLEDLFIELTGKRIEE